MTGSSKTGLLKVLVEEGLRLRLQASVIMIDIKGDLPNVGDCAGRCQGAAVIMVDIKGDLPNFAHVEVR